MSEKIAFTIRDKIAEVCELPVFATTRGEVMRDFKTIINKKDTKFGSHPADYDLYEVGTYDISTGKLSSIDPKFLANGNDFLDESNKLHSV